MSVSEKSLQIVIRKICNITSYVNSNEDKLYPKIVELDAVYNFIVDNFFYLKLFIVPKICFKFINFEI